MNLIDLLPIALLGAVLGMDVVTFPQAMISRPIVAATLAGAFIGNAPAGLVMGAVLELLALEMLPFGASRYPEWGSASLGPDTLLQPDFQPVGAGEQSRLDEKKLATCPECGTEFKP